MKDLYPALGTILESKSIIKRVDPEFPKDLFHVKSSKGNFSINLERAALVVDRLADARKEKDYFQ